MTGWIILGVTVLVLTLLCLMPVVVYVHYERELLLQLRIGPFTVPLLPKKEKKSKEKKATSAAAPTAEEALSAESPNDGQTTKEKKTKLTKPNKEQILYSIKTLPGILKKALRRTRKGILISPLRVKVVFAGEDPADVAENYGKAQALVSALFPEIKKLVRIKNARISLSANYERETMFLSLETGVRLRIGTILVIVCSAAFALLRWFMGYRKLAGAEKEPPKKTTEEKHDQAQAA